MTARFVRKNQGNGHSYTLDGYGIPGVTTVIGVLDKPALVGWAAEQAASYAVENWDALKDVPLLERGKRIKEARFNTNRKAVVKGNRIHALGDKLAHGETVEVPVEIRSQVEAYAHFLDAWEIDVIATETPVCSTVWRFGGTFDLLANVPRFGVSLIDIKTGGRVYDETALQLNAYAGCDLRLVEEKVFGPRGGAKPSEWHEAPMPERIDSLLVAHVMEGTVEMVPVGGKGEHKAEPDPAIFDTFLHLLDVFETWTRRTGWDHRDEPEYDPPVARPVWPEDVPVREVA